MNDVSRPDPNACNRQRPHSDPPAAPGPVAALLLTYEQAAELLQLGARTVRRLVERGELPAVRHGRAVRIDRRDLFSWIDAAKARGSSTAEGHG